MDTTANIEEFYILIKSMEEDSITKKISKILAIVVLGEVLKLVYIHSNGLELLMEGLGDFCLLYYNKIYCCLLTTYHVTAIIRTVEIRSV